MSAPKPIPSPDAAEAFRQAIANAGIEPPAFIEADGALHRFASNGERHDKAGWYLLHLDDLPAGAFGCWRLGVSQNWCARPERELSRAERTEFRRRIEEAEAARRKADEEVRRECRRQATAILERAQPADPEHPYLKRKQVEAHGIRQDGNRLVIPVRDVAGRLHGLQFIGPDGDKLFLTGTAKKGNCYMIGEPGDLLVVAEGFATAASVHEATGHAVAVAFDAGNLKPVAERLSALYPAVRFIVAGDNDASGVGQEKAKAAAMAVGGVAIIPPEVGDWNDVHLASGPDAARAAFLVDVGMVDVDHHHLGGAPGGAARLDGAGGAVADSEEAHEAGGLVADDDHVGAAGDDDATLARLAALSPIEYDRQRKAEAERLGIRPATLDAEVRRLRGEADPGDVGNGAAVALEDPEPWPEPVAGGGLLDALADAARRHLVLPAGAAEALALWALHAHTHDTAAISPILAATSPTPECGKTTLLTLMGALVPRPLPASNITAAALFRAVEKWQPTLLVDEADTFLKDSDELRGVINSGHNRASAFVIRTAGDDHEPRRFATWAPKAIALIGRLPPTLESRAAHIELRRIAEGEHVEALRGDRLHHLQPLCRQAARWAQDNSQALRHADPAMPAALRGRAADNWRHLLAIADAAGGDWPQRARHAAETLCAGRSERSAGIMLLEDLRALYTARRADKLSSAEIIEALGEMEDRPWPEWSKGKPITVRGLAKLLEPFKVHPRTIRSASGTPKGYLREQLNDAFARYLPAESATPPQSKKFNGLDEIPSDTPLPPVADTSGPNPLENNDCGGVADNSPETWEADL